MNRLIQASLTIFTKATAKSGVLALMLRKYDRTHEKYGKFFPASFFLAGFLFDVATLGRIDNWFTLAEQGAFLFVIALFLAVEMRLVLKEAVLPRFLNWLWNWREPVVHFLLGGLLSAFLIFYFKSSSGFSALVFVAIMCGVFVLNEHPRFRGYGLAVRFLLFILCLTSYLAYLIPILWGSIGPLPFIGAVCCSLIFLYLFLKQVLRGLSLFGRQVRRLFIPGTVLQAGLISFYFLGIFPPVPLSVQQLGIYHQVKKIEGHYELTYTRPGWKFWQNGDQTFFAKEGDRIYCFARIFSPTKFRERVHTRWLLRNRFGEWQTTDRIPIDIVGGRAEGYRGYTVKKNYQPGRWRVQIETSDGRELGRIHFTVINEAPEQARRPKTDYS